MSDDVRPADLPVAVFPFGEFTFDSGSRQLSCSGVARQLSPKAQQLLHLLIMARPRALSRQELYDALWPATFVSDTNLSTVVNEVRRVLGDDARAPHYIRTVHGFGYAFCGEVAASRPVPAAAATAKLFCDGQTHLLYDGENVVGRGGNSAVVIQNDTISRRHAVITVENDAFSILDLDSRNGTYVDGKRIGSAPVTVTSRTRIEFGAMLASILRRNNSSTQPIVLSVDRRSSGVLDRRFNDRRRIHSSPAENQGEAMSPTPT
jgi:DNA-binding winged helix-turn-helix (wHTH) protein